MDTFLSALVVPSDHYVCDPQRLGLAPQRVIGRPLGQDINLIEDDSPRDRGESPNAQIPNRQGPRRASAHIAVLELQPTLHYRYKIDWTLQPELFMAGR